jgi:hypothetical protein
MQTLFSTLVIATSLFAGSVAATGLAMAGSDGTYHWAYPGGFQNPVTVPALPGGSGIPAQYR